MKNGETVTTRKQGPDHYIKIAETIIDKLKSQMLIKARSMCLANGVEFEITIFETMFNNAKSSAVTTSVSGQDSSFFRHSESTLDPQKLVTTFTTEFKINFTAWVEKQNATQNNQ